MWIIPKNHPLFSHYAQESLALKEELAASLEKPESWLTWKGKRLSSKTFLRAWKRVFWLRHLSGRTLKPSLGITFAIKYSSCWVDIPASHSAQPAAGKAPKILDTYGRILNSASEQLDLFASSWKTSGDTSASEQSRLLTPFDLLVMRLSAEYSQRRKLARLTDESDYSSSESWMTPKTTSGDYTNDRGNLNTPRLTLQGQAKQWPTPRAESDQAPGAGKGDNLVSVVAKWGSPRVTTNGGNGNANRKDASRLEDQVQKWTTPQAFDSKVSGTTQSRLNRQTQDLSTQVQIAGQLARDSPNTTGKSRAQLNPAWVAQLMGTTLEKIFFVPLATEWSNKQQS